MGVDIVVRGIPILVVCLPGNDKAAITEAGNGGIRLRLIGRRVNPEIGTGLYRRRQGAAVIITRGEDLAADVNAGAGGRIFIVLVMGAALIITPGDDKLAITKTGDRRLVLGAALSVGVDQELFANPSGAGIITLTKDVDAGTAARTAVAAVITPGDNKLAVAEIGHRRLVLRTVVRIGVDQEVVADLRARCIETLTEDIDTAAAIMTAALVITPGDDKAAV